MLGNYDGPHHCDMPLAEIIDIAFTARSATISFEAANPRHAHEWTLFEQIRLPDAKIIIPGVIRYLCDVESSDGLLLCGRAPSRVRSRLPPPITVISGSAPC